MIWLCCHISSAMQQYVSTMTLTHVLLMPHALLYIKKHSTSSLMYMMVLVCHAASVLWHTLTKLQQHHLTWCQAMKHTLICVVFSLSNCRECQNYVDLMISLSLSTTVIAEHSIAAWAQQTCATNNSRPCNFILVQAYFRLLQLLSYLVDLSHSRSAASAGTIPISVITASKLPN